MCPRIETVSSRETIVLICGTGSAFAFTEEERLALAHPQEFTRSARAQELEAEGTYWGPRLGVLIGREALPERPSRTTRVT